MSTPGKPDKEDQLVSKSKLIYAFRETFSNDHGERVLKHLAKKYYFAKPSYVPGQPDATAYNEGQRSVLLYIMLQIRKNWDDLMTEIHQEQQSNEYPTQFPLPPPPP